jgi:hypothetical protein
MRDVGSAMIKILGIASAVVILALGASVVYGELTDGGIQCTSGSRTYMTGEPDLSEITAKSPEAALLETLTEDGRAYVGLQDVTGSPTELAAGFELVLPDPDKLESVQTFEYKDGAGTVLARVQVEAIGDGRYFVGSAQSCGG